MESAHPRSGKICAGLLACVTALPKFPSEFGIEWMRMWVRGSGGDGQKMYYSFIEMAMWCTSKGAHWKWITSFETIDYPSSLLVHHANAENWIFAKVMNDNHLKSNMNYCLIVRLGRIRRASVVSSISVAKYWATEAETFKMLSHHPIAIASIIWSYNSRARSHILRFISPMLRTNDDKAFGDSSINNTFIKGCPFSGHHTQANNTLAILQSSNVQYRFKFVWYAAWVEPIELQLSFAVSVIRCISMPSFLCIRIGIRMANGIRIGWGERQQRLYHIIQSLQLQTSRELSSL